MVIIIGWRNAPAAGAVAPTGTQEQVKELAQWIMDNPDKVTVMPYIELPVPSKE